jgi:lipoprotein-anchoring transpeptidase ErfK/SrfK
MNGSLQNLAAIMALVLASCAALPQRATAAGIHEADESVVSDSAVPGSEVSAASLPTSIRRPTNVLDHSEDASRSMAPYRWTQGNAARAIEAMVETFGKTSLRPGQYLWVDDIPEEGDIRIMIDLLVQMAYVYRDDQLIGVASISSGTRDRRTPLGFWSIQEKQRFYRSRKYDNAPMPFMQRIDEYGIALHAGVNPGYPASHGCIRLPPKFAERLFMLTSIGSEVVIEG